MSVSILNGMNNITSAIMSPPRGFVVIIPNC